MLKDFEEERQRQGRTTRLLDIQGKAFSFKLYYLNNSLKKERLEELLKAVTPPTRRRQKYTPTYLSSLRQLILLGESTDDTDTNTDIPSNVESNTSKSQVPKVRKGEYQIAVETALRKNILQIQIDIFNNYRFNDS